MDYVLSSLLAYFAGFFAYFVQSTLQLQKETIFYKNLKVWEILDRWGRRSCRNYFLVTFCLCSHCLPFVVRFIVAARKLKLYWKKLGEICCLFSCFSCSIVYPYVTNCCISISNYMRFPCTKLFNLLHILLIKLKGKDIIADFNSYIFTIHSQKNCHFKFGSVILVFELLFKINFIYLLFSLD